MDNKDLPLLSFGIYFDYIVELPADVGENRRKIQPKQENRIPIDQGNILSYYVNLLCELNTMGQKQFHVVILLGKTARNQYIIFSFHLAI